MIQANLHAGARFQDNIAGVAVSSGARSTLERMPKWLICIPLTLQWLWLALRYRSLSLPTIVNPAITAGGLVGEGKLEYFDGRVPSRFRLLRPIVQFLPTSFTPVPTCAS